MFHSRAKNSMAVDFEPRREGVEVTVVTEGANVVINEAGFFGTFVMVPVIDGDFIVERPVQTILKGKLNGVRHFESPRGYLKLMIKSIRRFSLR